LWVGEGIRNADTMREAVKNHLPYVVPCLDMSRARVEREDDLYLNIPYLQFPILLGGRPFTGERAAIPGVEYQPAFWTDHLRSIWRYYQAHPEGPFSYGWWDSCPGRRDARPAYYRWLKLYRRMAENGTWAWLEVTASDLFMEPLPEGVVASVFANRRIYLALANYSQRPVHVRTRKPHVGAEVPGEPATSWTIAPRSLTVLVTV